MMRAATFGLSFCAGYFLEISVGLLFFFLGVVLGYCWGMRTEMLDHQ